MTIIWKLGHAGKLGENIHICILAVDLPFLHTVLLPNIIIYGFSLYVVMKFHRALKTFLLTKELTLQLKPLFLACSSAIQILHILL